MSGMFILSSAFFLFLAFSIGVNLALHGIISIDSDINNKENIRSEFKKSIDEVLNESNGELAETNLQYFTLSTLPSSIVQVLEEKKSLTSNPTFSPTMVLTSPTTSREKNISDILNEIANDMNLKVKLKINRHSVRRDNGPVSAYLRKGGMIPIVLLTCNRPELLENTLSNLLQVRGVVKDNIIVMQDGALSTVASIVNQHGIKLIQNTEGLRLRGGNVDGAARIAMHYKFSLSKLFTMMPDAPAVIIVEDDLLFSPDFYEYFCALAPALEADPSLFVISAWNDNGFRKNVRNSFAMRRTEFFPGLGWLLPRALYVHELEATWPKEHWDHWLRSPQIHRGREIVYPEVPRTFHNGIQGTFMNVETHNRYFRDIAYNTDPSISWVGKGLDSNETSVFETVTRDNYEERMEYLIQRCTHVKDLHQLITEPNGLLCVWISANPSPADGFPPEFEQISRFFGLWHEHHRGSHGGVHETYFQSNAYVLIINVFGAQGDVTSYKHLKPEYIQPMTQEDFSPQAVNEAKADLSSVSGFAAFSAGQNCDQVCGALGKRCDPTQFTLINSCRAMKEKFPCKACSNSFGEEQPAYVADSAPRDFLPGHCLISTLPERATCSASHRATLRLCGCV